MNYEQFVCTILECTEKKLPEDEIVEKQEVQKNNGVTAVGLTIRKKGSQITPVIYMEEFYQKYLMGASIDDLSDFLITKSRMIPSLSKGDYKDIRDFGKIKNHIVYKLINAKKNEKLLREVPNLPILDLAIVFYWMIPMAESEYGSVLIKNEHMNLWKLPISVLYQCAKENTPRLLPYKFAPLDEYVKELAGEFIEESPLYILSNQMGLNGAVALLYPKMPEIVYRRIKKSYYLLPSSIHEFLIVPKSEHICWENLRRIVKEVNSTQISPEELLSNHIYYFDGDIITKM